MTSSHRFFKDPRNLPLLQLQKSVMGPIWGYYLSLSTPHLGIQSSWLQPLHAWRNFCWLSRPISLQLPQLAIQDSSSKPYLLEISQAESEAGNAKSLFVFLWEVSSWLLFHRINLHSVLWGTCMLVVAKVGNFMLVVSRGFLIRCEQRIWCFSSYLKKKKRCSNTWICKSLCISPLLMHLKVYWQFPLGSVEGLVSFYILMCYGKSSFGGFCWLFSNILSKSKCSIVTTLCRCHGYESWKHHVFAHQQRWLRNQSHLLVQWWSCLWYFCQRFLLRNQIISILGWNMSKPWKNCAPIREHLATAALTAAEPRNLWKS